MIVVVVVVAVAVLTLLLAPPVGLTISTLGLLGLAVWGRKRDVVILAISVLAATAVMLVFGWAVP